ncbi:ABC transporter ATP-binding protein [Candidatus Solirubrobacter pratensis]|uniref:ABC transporter ATP-binding protein n=1 Tax=Candidatus Solirubrobacter pratensis TaxID=1298857 RepID=UPI000415DCAD|nr:ABC transporter ATP-binding protein [Candidatus Solirubrobacter pratensis]
MAESEQLLEVAGLRAHYGSALAVEDATFAVGGEPVAIVGRNGMGKTTLCRAIAGIQPPTVQGSIRFAGAELAGRPSYRICQAGIGYVPQGRRLFGSLSVEEHLRMISPRLVKRGRWSIDAVYALFPRLAERRKVGGTQLSGGEQQMLAIARALLTNPRVLLMDEPSEGLAPRVVEELVETCRTLAGEGIGLLLVEQNLSVATALADRILVMVAGRIALETTAAALEADEDAQRRYLGVEPLAA